jgi:hypothetical protein
MKQLLQVVGGPGKLFLPVGAKTCFGGEAPRKQPFLRVGVEGWLGFFDHGQNPNVGRGRLGNWICGGGGVLLRIGSAEDLVVMKAFAARPHDCVDGESVVARHYGQLDWAYVYE